jgi:hypothetical protein
MSSTSTHSPSAASLFEQETLAVFDFLSQESRQALESFCQSEYRRQQVLEYFKCLDWLSPQEIPSSPLKKLPDAHQARIHREIQAYLKAKADTRQKNATRRKAHTLSVMEYFREKVSPQDKALLESLRDYELDRTGRDANWQHYFSFKSYKRIDTFIQASLSERQAWISQFKADVQTYEKNVEKLRHQAECLNGHGPLFSFDDWCDWVITEGRGDFGGRKKHAGQQQKRSYTTRPASPLEKAYRTLQLTPQATLEEVKKRFRQLTLAVHPDMPGGDAEQMKALISAYHTIKHASPGHKNF